MAGEAARAAGGGAVTDPIDQAEDPARHITVSEVMTRDPVTVSTSTPIKEAARLMSRERISAIPVIGIDGALVGVISATDFIDKRVDAEVVGELMSFPVATADPADIVHAAARTLLARNVKSLPVVDGDGKVIGMVSRGDLLKIFLRHDDDIRRDVTASISATCANSGGPEIEVSVIDGVVSLSGVVASPDAARRAVTAATVVSGVIHVRSDALSHED
jgi:CBS domain-containing protein